MPKFHKSATISKPERTVAIACGRCSGTGTFAHYGECFRCGGTGTDPTDKAYRFPEEWSDAMIEAWDAKRVARNLKGRERTADKRKAKFDAAAERGREFIAGVPGLATALKVNHPIIRDIRDKILRYGDASEKAIALVFKIATEMEKREAERKAAAASSDHLGTIGERRTFHGVVERIIEFDKTPMFYGDSTVGHITVVDVNGSKVKLWNLIKVRGADIWAEEGNEITFDAMVKDHGEYRGVRETVVKRPTKLKIKDENLTN